MSERKDFEEWKVDLVYKLQDGVCAKCGRPLVNGFHRHHKNGNPLDNSTENLSLFCSVCHGGEQAETLRKKKIAAIENMEALIKKGIEGGVAGAVLDKLLDAQKLALSLDQQVYGSEIEKPPASVSMENYLMSSGLLMKQYEQGFLAGLVKGSELTQESKKIVEERRKK